MKRKGFIKRFLAMLLVLVMVIPNNMVSMAANDAGDTTSNPPVETELDKESTVDDATDESIEDVEDVDDTTDMGEDKDVDDSTDMGEDEDVDADDVANTDDEESEKDAEDASDDTSVDGEDEETDDTQEKDEEKSEDEKDQPAVQEEEKTEQKTTKVPVRRSMAFRNVRSSTGSMTTEPIKGWNDEHSILTVKNTPESLDEYLKELGDYNKPSTTVKLGKISIPLNWDAIKILPLSYDIHSEDISHNMVYTATAYFEYSSWLGSVSASVELGTFTLKIYDKLTINTTVGSNDTTTETVWLYRDGSHTVTVADKSAENYDVTVTGAVKGTTAGSYIVSKLSSDASVNIVYTLDTQSTVTVDKNEDNATVSVQSSVDANVTVPVEIAPAKNYYVKSVTLTPGTLGNTTYSDGVCKTSFVSAANKTAYVLDVESELVLAPTGTTTINYNSTMDAASLKQEIFKKLVNAPEGVTANNVVVEFKVPEGLREKTVELTDETIDRFAKTLLGTADEKEKIIISYAGNGAKYPEATTEEMTVSVVDGRLTPTVNLIGNQELGYIGTELNGSTILAKVFQSVTYRNETITEDAEDVTITKIEKYNDTLGKYVNTLKTVIGGSDLQLGEVEGQYRITVGYVGNSTYGKATAEVELKVVDGRLETSINLEEGSLDMPTLDTRFTTNQILDAMKFKVSDENGNKVTDRAEDVVVTLYKGLSKVSEITEAGTYYVGVEYKETSTYKGCSTGLSFVKLTVNDTRIGTSVSLETGSLDMPTLDTTFTNAQILEAMNFVVLDDKANSVTDKAEDVSVVVTPVITVAGEYKVKVTYAANNTHKGSEAEETLTINDTRTETAVNLKEDQTIPYTVADTVTEEEAFDLVFDSVTNVPDYAYVAGNVTITDGENIEVTSDIAAVGTYYITVKYNGSNELKPSESKVAFSVTDGRNITKVNITLVDVAYDFADGLNKEEVLDALNVSVVDVTANNAEITDYTVIFKEGEKEISAAEMKVDGTYTITIEFAGNDTQLPVKVTETFQVVDGRYETTVNLKEEQTIIYSEETTPEDIFNLVFDSIIGADNKEVGAVFAGVDNSEVMTLSDGNVTITMPTSLNVGKHTVKVNFLGDNNYKPSAAEVEFEVKKGTVALTVNSATIKYADISGSYNAENLISANPNAEYISFAVGLGLGNDASADAGAVAYVDLPEIIDLDSINNSFVKAAIEKVLDKLGEGTTMSVSELKSALEGVLKGLENIEGLLEIANINLNLDSINSLVSVLEQIEDLEGIGNLTIKLTIDKGLNVTDAGVYLVGAVTSDTNYETAYGLNYLIITPNGKKVELDWIIEDENGFVTIGAIANGEYDLGAYVSKVYEGTADAAEKQLVELFLGVNADGNPILTTEQSELTFGAYTEIAFIRDLGNEMYYAVPIVRPVVVVADLVDVKFVDLNGNENYDRIFTFDGTPKAMVAEAYDRAGKKLDSNNITYRYIGIESDAEGYYSSAAPTETGVYTVVVVYKEAGNTRVGMTVGAMLIQPAEAIVAVDNAKHVYDGNAYDVNQMIKHTPEDAKLAVITAGVVIEGGDFSTTTGEINIDLPERAESVFEQVFDRSLDSYEIDKEDFIQATNELKAALEDADIDASAIDEIINMLNQIPDVVKITFKDQADVNPSEIGVYFVGAIVFDPNYVPEAGAGILVITPEDVHVDFEPDSNIDNAREFVYDGEAKEMPVVVKYFGRDDVPAGTLTVTYIGVDSQGHEYNSTEAPTNVGVYSVIAIYEEYEGEKLVAYGANVGAMVIKPAEVDVKAAIDDILCGCGCDTKTCSTKCAAETDCGCKLNILDKIEIDAVKADELTQITVIVDEEGNVNVLLPEDWDVESSTTENTIDDTIAAIIEEIAKVETIAGSEAVSKAIASVIDQLTNLETDVLDTEAQKVIDEVVKQLKSINTATVKAALNRIIEEVKALGLDSEDAVNVVVTLLESLKTQTNDVEIATTINEIIKTLETVDTDKLDTATKAALGAIVAMVKELDLTELKEAAKTSIDAIIDELESIDTSVLTTEADKAIAAIVKELTALKEDVENVEPNVASVASQLTDILEKIENTVGKVNTLSINGEQKYTCGTYSVYVLAFGPNHEVGYGEDTFKIYAPDAKEEPKDDEDDKESTGGSSTGSGSGSSGSKDDSGKELEGVYEAPTAPSATTGTSTGDSANILGYAAMIVVAGAALVLLFFKKKRA